jgi:hypothetical protein
MEKRQSIEEALRLLGLEQPKRQRRGLSAGEIGDFFRAAGATHLWVTDMFGDVRQTIALKDCFRFWKSELKNRILEEPFFVREEWPGGYAYQVSEWTSPFAEPLLELQRWE